MGPGHTTNFLEFRQADPCQRSIAILGKQRAVGQRCIAGRIGRCLSPLLLLARSEVNEEPLIGPNSIHV